MAYSKSRNFSENREIEREREKSFVRVLYPSKWIPSIRTHNQLLTYSRRPGEPPLVPGHLVWGNGATFAKDAVAFLLESRKKYGNVFTICLLNCHMTILMDHRDFELLGKEKNFDFDQIQKQVRRLKMVIVLIVSCRRL